VKPAEAPENPKLRRLIVNDATFEALHQTMSEKCAGVFLLRDELSGMACGAGKSEQHHRTGPSTSKSNDFARCCD
jgi:hypothetical protein